VRGYVSLRVPEDLRARALELAVAEDRSVSSLFRQALRERLDREPETDPDRQAPEAVNGR